MVDYFKFFVSLLHILWKYIPAIPTSPVILKNILFIYLYTTFSPVLWCTIIHLCIAQYIYTYTQTCLWNSFCIELLSLQAKSKSFSNLKKNSKLCVKKYTTPSPPPTFYMFANDSGSGYKECPSPVNFSWDGLGENLSELRIIYKPCGQ
jgi:hypothetical protein